jgi:hypothetical protein
MGMIIPLTFSSHVLLICMVTHLYCTLLDAVMIIGINFSNFRGIIFHFRSLIVSLEGRRRNFYELAEDLSDLPINFPLELLESYFWW